MPNDNGNSDDGPPFHSDGTHQEGTGEQNANITPEMLETMALYSQGPVEAEARIGKEHDEWKSIKALDDLIGKDTDKWIKRFCVAEVAAYYNEVKFAKGKPNAGAIEALAWKTALRGLTRLLPNLAQEKLVQLLQYKPEELED